MSDLTRRTCRDCDQPAIVTLNGQPYCLEHFEDGRRPLAVTLRALRALAQEER